ncbi:protein-L-isoaspartate(D-aspartate) O-methyltransferase [Streptomyces sp. CB02009]|uniref:ATP-grasp peptide maturase system methyltransferase n=1 Tax=Streptomyces sp. CB02009 TaxID=1703938 RepID=UPI000939AA9A|nr:ATP-grasp peptide maturase system methyltransferase [Streptomyces sp. CB02009]OKJ49583.1 protein-L-isoaspartate(D-aspartate) O-methyltransferase [Streptomyces sp. CB02009]
MTDQARSLRAQLLNELTAAGVLRTDAWKAAAGQVARHEFLRGGFFRNAGGAAWEPVLPNDPGWLESCYRDESLVTQIAGTILPQDVHGQILREPTSSSTLPSLVLRMLEDLQVEPGMRVLEIGTGTGYSTAILATRLGDDLVTSVECDSDIASRAGAALWEQGIRPTLVTGDGLQGHPEGAPYDRIIATCGIKTVPAAWIEQTRPGGLILATIGGWLHASELARLTVHEDGTASGPLLGGQVSFMLARPQSPPPLGLLPDLGAGTERVADIGADALDAWTARFITQFAVPNTQRLTLTRDGRTEHVLLDLLTGSWAAVYEEAGQWIARQDGPDPLWDTVEEHLGRWHITGRPALDKATLTVTSHGQTLAW